MRSPPYLANKTARMSQKALLAWASENAYHCVFLDAPSGNPRTGIVDAVLMRHPKGQADVLEVLLVQLKGGGAGFRPIERTRLMGALQAVRLGVAVAMWDRESIAVDILEIPDVLAARKSRAATSKRRK